MSEDISTPFSGSWQAHSYHPKERQFMQRKGSTFRKTLDSIAHNVGCKPAMLISVIPLLSEFRYKRTLNDKPVFRIPAREIEFLSNCSLTRSSAHRAIKRLVQEGVLEVVAERPLGTHKYIYYTIDDEALQRVSNGELSFTVRETNEKNSTQQQSQSATETVPKCDSISLYREEKREVEKISLFCQKENEEEKTAEGTMQKDKLGDELKGLSFSEAVQKCKELARSERLREANENRAKVPVVVAQEILDQDNENNQGERDPHPVRVAVGNTHSANFRQRHGVDFKLDDFRIGSQLNTFVKKFAIQAEDVYSEQHDNCSQDEEARPPGGAREVYGRGGRSRDAQREAGDDSTSDQRRQGARKDLRQFLGDTERGCGET